MNEKDIKAVIRELQRIGTRLDGIGFIIAVSAAVLVLSIFGLHLLR